MLQGGGHVLGADVHVGSRAALLGILWVLPVGLYIAAAVLGISIQTAVCCCCVSYSIVVASLFHQSWGEDVQVHSLPATQESGRFIAQHQFIQCVCSASVACYLRSMRATAGNGHAPAS